MIISHNLGFPRLGAHREMKRAQESYWRGDLSRHQLLEEGTNLCRQNWQWQAEAGLDLIPVGDFSWYDHVLDTSVMLGVVPERFGARGDAVDLDTMFRMARGIAPGGKGARACEMTKWFDTNYHYIVPEFRASQDFGIFSERLFDEITEAVDLGYKVKPVLVGPLSYLWLGKSVEDRDFDKLSLLPGLLDAYAQILQRIAALPVEWVQMDEPVLVMDLSPAWRDAFASAYERLAGAGVKIFLATYFGGLEDNFDCAARLPVAGLHIDGVRGGDDLLRAAEKLDPDTVLSAGVVDGRNIWRKDLKKSLNLLLQLQQVHPKLWVAPACSLLHVPVDLDTETALDDETRSWFAFARQKSSEVSVLARVLRGEHGTDLHDAITSADRAMQLRKNSARVHNPQLQARIEAVSAASQQRKTPYRERARLQRENLHLPAFPATTIGSFPQTAEVRRIRRKFKQGEISEDDYRKEMRAQIADAVSRQESIGLDVLVHGEPERNDMVEYFGELMQGFLTTTNGWVQSYGSRCIKPPVIFGDITRAHAMTVEWSAYAQSLTGKPMKGMLTGPITILRWSFPRDDVSPEQISRQIALALREEVLDLEKNGIRIIQIDEPALREALPLRKSGWQGYLDRAVQDFHVVTGGVADDTQVHTHMCYSEFNDIIKSIIALDADVISIEASRSNMELLDAFERFDYPNEIGPGVYDIHSPLVPTPGAMVEKMVAAEAKIAADRLWVNPDCGLKTRGWEETTEALTNMVAAARQLRERSRG